MACGSTAAAARKTLGRASPRAAAMSLCGRLRSAVQELDVAFVIRHDAPLCIGGTRRSCGCPKPCHLFAGDVLGMALAAAFDDVERHRRLYAIRFLLGPAVKKQPSLPKATMLNRQLQPRHPYHEGCCLSLW